MASDKIIETGRGGWTALGCEREGSCAEAEGRISWKGDGGWKGDGWVRKLGSSVVLGYIWFNELGYCVRAEAR